MATLNLTDLNALTSDLRGDKPSNELAHEKKVTFGKLCQVFSLYISNCLKIKAL